MFDTKDMEAATGIFSLLGGGTPPVFEEYGAEALGAGTVRAAGGELDGVSYVSSDAGVYDLSTPQGRRAWKASAPKGVIRIVLEDGDAWLMALVGHVEEAVAGWMEGRGVQL